MNRFIESVQLAGDAILVLLALCFFAGMVSGIVFSHTLRRVEHRRERKFERWLHNIARDGSELIAMERKSRSATA